MAPSMTSDFGSVHTTPHDFATTSQQQRDEHLRSLVDGLRGSQPAELFHDSTVPEDRSSGMIGKHEFKFDRLLSSQLRDFSASRQYTDATTLLTAFRAAQYRLTGALDVNIGFSKESVDGRDECYGKATSVSRVRPVRTIIQDDTNFENLLLQVSEQLATTSSDQEVTIERLAEQLSPNHHPDCNALIKILFVMHSQRPARVETLCHTGNVRSATAFEVEWHIWNDHGRLRGLVLYASDILDKESVISLEAAFCDLLGAGLHDSTAPISQLRLVRGLDRIISAVDRNIPLHQASVYEAFREQVVLHPHDTSVKDSSQSLTYAQLDCLTQQVSDWLSQRKYPAETMVGVLASRSVEAIVMYIGILRANHAYVPLDVKSPVERLSSMLSSIGARPLVLYSTSLEALASRLPDAECVSFSRILEESNAATLVDHMMPLPSTLAAVIFTSGSTGKPKGVMIEHRSIVRVAKQQSYQISVDSSLSQPAVAHILNPAFDAAMMEIYTALLNGHTLYCVDELTLLDSRTLSRVFERENIRMAVFTPALLNHCLRESPELFEKLKILVVGGDRFKASHAKQLKRLVPGKVFNGYGPTENTVVSTLYAIPANTSHITDNVPIGQAVTGSIACVMDTQQQLLPPGVIGELIVAGDGLARGYIDAKLNEGRFVDVSIGGKSVRAYRTGDLARLRPKDMQLQFLGRVDQQVKVRGHRIEIAEIDKQLLEHPSVGDAATINYSHGTDSESELVSFITKSSNSIYANLSTKVSRAELGRDFVGWISMYDGSAIPRNEMEEWLDDTLRTISESCPHGKMRDVLEIGSGSGMILFNLAPRSQRYVAVEPSLDAVNFVNAATPENVHVHQGSAATIGRWMSECQPDLIIVNSVVQYFPSAEYLYKVIEDCAQQLHSNTSTRLFFGDVRSHALYQEFLVHKTLRHVNSQTSLADVLSSVLDQARLEKELLIDPAFFTGLLGKLEGVKHVEILPKRMRTTNELSCYRYAAVIHLQGAGALPLTVRSVDEHAWIDAVEQQFDRSTLAQRLSENVETSQPSEVVMAVSNIINTKTKFEGLVVDALKDPSSDRPQWTANVQKQAANTPSFDVMDLEELAKAAGLKVVISWARQSSQRGGLDAIFYRRANVAANGNARTLFRFPVDHKNLRPGALCNKPLQVEDYTAFREQIETWVSEKLPSYMVPCAIFVIKELPLTNNGKLDQKALAKVAAAELESVAKPVTDTLAVPSRRSGSAVEMRLKELWALVLNIPVASITSDDHFVRKGGDSIKAMRLTAEARRAGLVLSIPDILTSPRLCDMATKASEDAETQDAIFNAPGRHDVQPFELLKQTTEAEARSIAASQCKIQADSIEDIYPCTPLQAGFVALNLANPSDYVSRFIKEFHTGVDIERFKRAFEGVVQAHPILRTRIIYLPGEGFVQLITGEPIHWSSGSSVQDYIQADRENFMGLGRPLVRAALIKEGTRDILVMTMLHSAFDGWTMKILFDALNQSYQGLPIPAPPPFQSFIKAIVGHNESEAGKQAWRTNLQGNQADQFPRLPSTDYRPKSDSVCSRRFGNLDWTRMDVTAAIALRAAFAITICQRENVDDAVFGTTVTGRNSIPVPGIEQMTGPTITTVPTRATLSRQDETVGELLSRLQAEWAHLAAYEHMGLSAIRDLSDDAMRATMFQTLLVVQPAEERDETKDESNSLFKYEANVRVADNDLGAISTYAMVMECQLTKDGLVIRVTFDSQVIPELQMERLLSQYETILRKLALPEVRQQRMPNIEWLSELDLSDIWKWNATYPETVDTAVHNLLSTAFQRRPDAQAICAWDGTFTYTELDSLSSRLAHYMLDQDIVSSAVVPIYQEKSKWTSVAMLAVMKAGGTSCLLDPTLPQMRLRAIIEQLRPSFMLISSQYEEAARGLFTGRLLNIDAAEILSSEPAASPPQRDLPAVSPDTPLYIVFTSGSTGLPKGVVISHRNFSSAIVHQHPRRSVGPQSRVLDFSSLAFDGSWFNLLHTLYAGGCICVPSETGRQDDLKGCILQLRANFAFLTPTVASTLDAEALEAMESLEIGGEAADQTEMLRIQEHTQVRFIYGPSECTPITTLAKPGAHALSIGYAAGVLPWLVDPKSPERLVGVGCVAELWLEGPVVGAGYYNDRDRSAAAFVTNPPWMTRDREGRPGREGRAYRTGDLVRYHPDGNMEFVGRNNMQQVKIRGQRVDLLDVQHHVQNVLKKHLPEVQVVAEVGGVKDGILVAFVCLASKTWLRASFDGRVSMLKKTAGNIKDELMGVLPKYMVPGLFIPLQSFPLTPTGKLDRRKLLATVTDITRDQRDACRMERARITSANSKVWKPTEKRLRLLWATALGVDDDHITTDDNFFHRGGDSITAMRLVNVARRENLVLSVRDIWDHPRLEDLAAHIDEAPTIYAVPEPVTDTENLPLATRSAPISEVLPVTGSQHQFLEGTANGYSPHLYYLLLDVPATLDADRVKNACSQWIHHHDVLRARFMCARHRVVQVIDREISLPWQEREVVEGGSLEDEASRTCEEDRNSLGDSPDPLSYMTRLFFFRRQDGTQKLVVRLGHAQYDGISLPRMLSALIELLDGRQPVPARPFADYVRHVLSQNPNSYQYWRDLLRGTDAPTTIMPIHERANQVAPQLLTVGKTITQPLRQDAAQTPAIRFMASCAAMLAQFTYSDDVVFGCIVSGRSAVPLELQDVAGPCLNEIPLRVAFPDGNTAAHTVFNQVREQLLESSVHDTVDFDEIATHCTSWSPDIEDFGLTAHYQNSGDLDLDGAQELKTAGSTVIPCRLLDRGQRTPIPKANYIEVEAMPLANDSIRINVMAKSSLYNERFLKQLLAKVCSGMSA